MSIVHCSRPESKASLDCIFFLHYLEKTGLFLLFFVISSLSRDTKLCMRRMKLKNSTNFELIRVTVTVADPNSSLAFLISTNFELSRVITE